MTQITMDTDIQIAPEAPGYINVYTWPVAKLAARLQDVGQQGIVRLHNVNPRYERARWAIYRAHTVGQDTYAHCGLCRDDVVRCVHNVIVYTPYDLTGHTALTMGGQRVRVQPGRVAAVGSNVCTQHRKVALNQCAFELNKILATLGG